MEEEQIIRFLTHQCSADEVEKMAAWIAADESNATKYFEVERIWNLKEEAKFADKKELDFGYKQLISKIEEKKPLEKKKNLRIYQWLSYAAAVVLFGLLTFNLYLNEDDGIVALNIIEVPNGQQVNLTLSDGTKIMLNSGSRFTYPSNFSSKNRIVELTGEGYFDVTHQEGNPFIVNMPLLEIKVLGTKFNVRAYENENTEVTLEKGKVEILVEDSAKKVMRNGLKLYPNQQLLCTPDKKVTLKEVNPAGSKNWLAGGFFFDNQPLSNIAKDLERRFNVEIQIPDTLLAKEIFTCHTKARASLDQILEVLKNTKELTYVQNENTYIVLTTKSKSPMK